MGKSNAARHDPDRHLWERFKQTLNQAESPHPSPEELAQFLDQTADELLRKKIFTWLASGDRALDELHLLQEPLPSPSRLDRATLERAKGRARAVLTHTLPRKAGTRHPFAWRERLINFFTLREWIAATAATCVLIIFSFIAFRLGAATFQSHRQIEEALTRELTFGLSETFPTHPVLSGISSENGGT